MLEVRQLSAAYGPHPALKDAVLKVAPGEIVVILGANGAGKSTLLRAVSGICEGTVTGEVTLGGRNLLGLSSDEIVEAGVALVPEGRGIFGDLTVRENLLLGAYPARARADESANIDRVMSLFPKLRERQGQIARTMSGGEQQMVAIGRAMMSAPEILMLDEPSLGLSPLLCKELFANLSTVKNLGIGVLLVEQNAKQSLAIADRGYLLENTQITLEDTAQNLATNSAVQAAYLGGGGRRKAPPTPTEAPAPVPTQAFTAQPTPRRNADQQIGFSIDALVEKAAVTSKEAPRTAAPKTVAEASRLAQTKVQTVLHDIETAAAKARNRAANTSQHQRPEPTRPQPEAAKPPVIEIYKRPRVEVYRRRPTGAFERD